MTVRSKGRSWQPVVAGCLASGLAFVTACRPSVPLREPFDESVSQLLTQTPLKRTVDQLALPLLQARRNIGMVVAVTRPEGDDVFTYGTTDLEGLKPMPRDGVFQVGSVTKTFTAILAAELAAEGRLDLLGPVSQVFPPHVVPQSRDLGDITFAELASHTSGLPHEGYTLELLWGVISYLVSGKNLYRYYNQSVMEDYVKTYEFKAPQRKTYGYSNIGYSYLGWALGRVDGKGYSALVREKILEPLGMHRTGFSLPTEDTSHLLPGYAGDLPTFIPRHRPVDPWLFDDGIVGAGGMYSTADDLLTYVKANMGVHSSPLARAMDASHVPIARMDEDSEMALSWFVRALPESKRLYISAEGIVGGHTSFIGFNRETKVGIVVLQNSINHDDMIAVTLLDRLVGAAVEHDEIELVKRGKLARPLRGGRIAKHQDSDAQALK